jgi:hypothetical protein
MRTLISIYLAGFLLDALLSIAAGWLPISTVHHLVAWIVFVLGLALYAGAAFDQRLPKRLILPSVLFLVWTNLCGAFPLAFVAPKSYLLALGVAQLLIALGLLVVHRRWRATPPPLGRAFSWRTFSLITLPTLLALPFILLFALLNALGIGVEKHSHGYVKLRPEGLMLEERELAKDGRHVRLVSMMHVGDKSFYDQILASLPPEEIAIVLVEGVTDDHGVLKSHFSYDKIARLFGLSSQENSSLQEFARTAVTGTEEKSPARNSRVVYRHADVDISTFQPLTLEYIGALGEILSDPTMETLSRVVSAPDTPFKNPDVEAVVMGDILDQRNLHLMAEIGSALETSHDVVVPWGALHLPYVEAELKKQGFEETHRIDRPIIRFWPAPAATPGP